MGRFFLVAGLIISALLLINFPILYSYLALLSVLILAFMAFSYHTFEEKHNFTCDVIIPAYNEGEHIFETVKSVMQSNYKNFNIIVIDDGSADDTRYWIKKAQEMFPDKVKTVLFDENKGKKHALAAGIRESRSDYIVTIDSDSVIDKDAIYKILSPFTNQKVGAVAGDIHVQNLDKGIIPKIMDVIFVYAYELFRCSQSRMGSVLCTPGALSAYRREALEPLLDTWLAQKFLGHATAIGEDRALTCLLIRNHWDIVYQESALAYTNMPEKYKDLCKMLLRWLRGDMRENIMLTPFIIRNTSLRNIKSIGLLFHFVVFNVGTFAPAVVFPVLVAYYACNFNEFLIVGPFLGMIALMWTILPPLIYMRRKSFKNAFHSITFTLFTLTLIAWVPCYALLTMNNNSWLTRNATQKKKNTAAAAQTQKIS